MCIQRGQQSLDKDAKNRITCLISNLIDNHVLSVASKPQIALLALNMTKRDITYHFSVANPLEKRDFEAQFGG